jgi:hypothetical protein
MRKKILFNDDSNETVNPRINGIPIIKTNTIIQSHFFSLMRVVIKYGVNEIANTAKIEVMIMESTIK